MPEPVIITCAPTGGIHTPTMSPHLPMTPDEIAGASIEAAGAGAAIIHLHAATPRPANPTRAPSCSASSWRRSQAPATRS